MNQAELQALAMGRSFSSASVPPSNSNQTIIVRDNNVSNDCVPCEEGAGCTVGATTAVNLDLSQFKTVDGTKLRWTVVNTGSTDKKLTLLGGFLPDTENYYTAGVTAITSPSVFTGGVTVSASTAALPVSQQNLVFHTFGALISRVIIRFANTDANAGLQDSNLTSFRIAVDPNDTNYKSIIYDPFCDYCVTTNTTDYTTHAYTITAPISGSQGLVIPVPAGTSFTVELCYGLLGIPNHSMDRAANQWNAC